MNLSLGTFLFILPFLILCFIFGFLTWHRGFRDEFIGRLAAFFVTACTIIIIGASFKGYKEYKEIPLEVSLLLWGLTLFMIRFVLNFIKWWKKSGKFMKNEEKPCKGCAYGDNTHVMTRKGT